ncbi:hypothetical protein ACFE04_021327 [Oxalis oulophora]
MELVPNTLDFDFCLCGYLNTKYGPKEHKCLKMSSAISYVLLSFMYFLQFVGSFCCLSTYRPYHETKSWEFVKVSVDDLSVEAITATDNLKFKETIANEN